METTEIRKHALESLHREGEQINHRIDWFLIFHGILLEAFFASGDKLFLKLPVALFGLVTAYLWLMIGARQNWQWRHLNDAVVAQVAEDMSDPLYVFHRRLTDIRSEKQPPLYRWVRATPIFTLVIPLTTMVTWLAVLIGTILSSRMHWAWTALPVVAIYAATKYSIWLNDRPKIAPDAVAKLFAEPPTANRDRA